MTNIPQFGTNTDCLCQHLNELFCICLHAMVYATVDIMDRRSSLPTVQDMKSIINASPAVHGAELRKKELTVEVLVASYKKALSQNCFVKLAIVNRENIITSLWKKIKR